mmetsp:Transcript_6252/g.15831  ORF Transcript_6252/g.15831 Transcript_6252/m.15831 type:complete len:1005 (-) Transcript_6252:441-3455(-)
MAPPVELEMRQASVTVDTVDGNNFDEITTDEALKLMHVNLETGLTTDQFERRIRSFGPNAFPEKTVNPLLQFLSFMWNPLSWVMEMAALVALVLSNGTTSGIGGPPDYPDFIGIVLLLFVNATIGFLEERQAGNAVAALKAALAPLATVKRDGEWKEIDASGLVPGDIISVKLGDVIPADGKVLGDEGLKVDQAALTGESLPVSKSAGQNVYSGSTVKMGESEMLVLATGTHTFFGKAAHLVESTEDSGHFQEILGKIGTFCIGMIALFLIITVIVQYTHLGLPYRTGINNILTLLIGGVPIAMPTVLSVTLAIGATELSKKQAIVTRITAIEELAGMSMLCSDKTGTLTLNKLTINRDAYRIYDSEYDVDTCMCYAARASRLTKPDAIDACIVKALGERGETIAREGIEELHFMPFDPIGKRTQITYRDNKTGKVMRITKGAPQVIADMCTGIDVDKVDEDVTELAERGYRALGLAICEVNMSKGFTGKVTADQPKGSDWKLLANMAIFDPPRSDTAETIQKALEMGVPVKMLTGDALAIAKETGQQLGMGTNMYNTRMVFTRDGEMKNNVHGIPCAKLIEDADGFAGVFPEHKYAIVQKLQEMEYVVGMTGDGVNDAPALKAANIGVAVADATDAARGAADLVLIEEGLGVIIDAIIESRKIFQRMVNYSMYACATTVGIVARFSIAVWAFEFNMPPFLILIMAYLNDGTIMAISTDNVSPSPYPDKWKLSYIFLQGTVFGLWMTASTLALISTINRTSFFYDYFGLRNSQRMFFAYDYAANGDIDSCLRVLDEFPQMQDPEFTCEAAAGIPNTIGGVPIGINDWVFHSIIYLQTSILGQALIFVTRSRWFFFQQRPSLLLVGAFIVAQVVATLIAVYANWGFTQVGGMGWGWALAVWVWDIIWFLPLDLLKIVVRSFFEGNQQGRLRNLFFRNQAHGIIQMDIYRRDSLRRTSAPTSTLAAHRAQARAKLSRQFSQNEKTMNGLVVQTSVALQSTTPGGAR